MGCAALGEGATLDEGVALGEGASLDEGVALGEGATLGEAAATTPPECDILANRKLHLLHGGSA